MVLHCCVYISYTSTPSDDNSNRVKFLQITYFLKFKLAALITHYIMLQSIRSPRATTVGDAGEIIAAVACDRVWFNPLTACSH